MIMSRDVIVIGNYSISVDLLIQNASTVPYTCSWFSRSTDLSIMGLVGPTQPLNVIVPSTTQLECTVTFDSMHSNRTKVSVEMRSIVNYGSECGRPIQMTCDGNKLAPVDRLG